MIQKVIDALGSPEIAVDDRHGPKLYSRLLTGLLATVNLDAPYPAKRGSSHTRRPSSKNSSLASSSPSRSSISPLMSNSMHLNDQVYQLQTEDGQNSPDNGSTTDSPSSMKGLNVQDFFAPPLPFDGELLHSVQNLTNSTEWEGLALPGVHCSHRVDVIPDTDCTCLGWKWMDGLQSPGETQRGILSSGNRPPFPAPDVFAAMDFSAPGFQRY